MSLVVLVEGYVSSLQHVGELSGSPVQVMLSYKERGLTYPSAPRSTGPCLLLPSYEIPVHVCCVAFQVLSLDVGERDCSILEDMGSPAASLRFP